MNITRKIKCYVKNAKERSLIQQKGCTKTAHCVFSNNRRAETADSVKLHKSLTSVKRNNGGFRNWV